MSSTAVELRSAAAPVRIGQATAIEQSRAVAEVQAQVIVAQQMPRDVERAIAEMRRSCARKSLAEKAFYRFPRGRTQVTGESIVLAKELARCWGNIDYGLAELRRDDFAGESEMMAFAWDLQTNTRPRTTFIVPHIRDKRDGGERLTETRDVYELNANMGARRMREMIFNVLPPWFIEEAKELCYKTLEAGDGDGKTVAERAAVAIGKFGRIGVRPEQLTQKLGAPVDAWSPSDLARLAVIFKSIERGESSKEDEFGATSATITPGDLAPPQNVPPAGEQPPLTPAAVPDPTPAGPAGGTQPRRASTGQVGMIRKKFRELFPYDGDDEPQEARTARLRRTSRLAGIEYPGIGSTTELTVDEASLVRRELATVTTAAELDALIATLTIGADPRDDTDE